ncbi:MAG: hypothetical protein KDK10_08985 [Maritimibacter sp.]|nr:hypothetical protein [Maritimibacter sp.]
MIEKSIEIYYDVSTILHAPGGDLLAALEFRNDALEVIDAALEDAGAGEWEGAEIGTDPLTGAPEVNFGFAVDDFDLAEAIVRAAVADTPYVGIREIRRSEQGAPHYA